jgi:translocation and assembly module TamA
LNTIKPGDVYSETALLELQARLQDSRYFTAVAVSADLNLAQDAEQLPSPNMTPIRVPVRIALTEQRLKKVDLGIGYSTNTGNRLQATYTNLNWFGAQVDSALTLETRKQSARVDFQLPVGTKSYADTVSAALERTDINSEVTRIATLAYKRTWGTLNTTRSVTLEYQNEQKIIDGFPQVISQTLPFTYQFTRRDFDQLLFPTRGHALTFQVGGTPIRLLSDEPFVRGSVKYLQYWTLNKQFRLVARAELGGLASRDKDGVPSTFFFRAGGDSSVRGYGFAELGERVGDAIVGARYLGTASIEGQYWVREKLGIAAFYDAGNAQDSLKTFRPKSGYGLGGRWKSPVGPINLDLAYGHAVRKFRLHFSLGLLF